MLAAQCEQMLQVGTRVLAPDAGLYFEAQVVELDAAQGVKVQWRSTGKVRLLPCARRMLNTWNGSTRIIGSNQVG